MSIQPNKPKPNDVYSSPYLVDYYDIVAPNSKSVDDAAFYWRAFSQLKALHAAATQHQHQHPFVVMDVGTGTGRVLHGLAASALDADADAELVDTEFLGVDNAPHMLDKARLITGGLLQNRVSWILGSALDLESIMANREHQKVDLLIFSIGSISHLSEDGQPEIFLEQVAKVLRPETGRAFVSIFDGSLLQKKEQVAFHQPQGVTETPSKSYPGVVYREMNHGADLKDKVKYVQFTMQVVDRSDGQDKIIEDNQVSMKMRQWEEDELTTMMPSELEMVERVRGKQETFYVFSRQ